MSGPGPFGDNPFEGLPFFGDLGKILGGGAGGRGLQWDTARQVAMQLAASGDTGANVDPLARIDLEQLARVAELQVGQLTGLSTSVTGAGVRVTAVTRLQWVQQSLEAFRPLFEGLARGLGTAVEQPAADPEGADPFSAMLNQVMSAMAPMMLAVSAGGMIGHLAERSFGQYDLPLPRQRSDELLVLLPNVDQFGEDWSLERADLRLWICLREVSTHAVLGVPHVRAALEQMLSDYSSSFRADPTALTDRLGSLELSGPDALQELQATLGDPGVMLGAIQSDAQREMLPRLEALVALIVGYVDHVMDRIGGTLIGTYPRITEAVRRRRVESQTSDQFVAKLFGLRIDQATYDRGAAFVDGVVERAGFDALEPLWRSEEMLPTPTEIEAPGLWLARIELPGP